MRMLVLVLVLLMISCSIDNMANQVSAMNRKLNQYVEASK